MRQTIVNISRRTFTFAALAVRYDSTRTRHVILGQRIFHKVCRRARWSWRCLRRKPNFRHFGLDKVGPLWYLRLLQCFAIWIRFEPARASERPYFPAFPILCHIELRISKPPLLILSYESTPRSNVWNIRNHFDGAMRLRQIGWLDKAVTRFTKVVALNRSACRRDQSRMA